MGLMMVLMVALLVLVIMAIIYGIQYILGAGRRREKGEEVLDILKKRYARGDITKEQYECLKDDLKL